MPTKQGNLKDYNGNKIAPNTLSSAVYDAAREQALSATLLVLVEKNALGFPTFSTVVDYPVDWIVFYDRRLWKFTSQHAAGAWDANDVQEYSIKELMADLSSSLESGSLVPALAGNLKSWNDRDDQNVESVMTETVRTTGGDESINADGGATLMGIVATADFSASKLVVSGFNLLRLQSNNGPAVAVGTGFYFPVPACAFGQYGTAVQNNGVILTDNNGGNLGYASAGRPTVYFKAKSAGVPASVTDGVNLNGDSQYYHDDATHGIRFYLPPAEGYLIVSDINWANTCAHMAWSKQYDTYVSPTSEGDGGTIIDLSALGTMRVVGAGAAMIQDRADHTDATHMLLTTKVGRIQPTWTRGEQDEETGLYPYTATISGIKAGGIAEFEGADKPAISVEGTTLTYFSESDTALTDYVKYELATVTTSSKAVVTSVSALNDWGIDALVGASGSAIITWQYAQGIPDALVQLLSKIDNSTVPVIAEAFASLHKRIATLEAALLSAERSLELAAKKVDTDEYFQLGIPRVLTSTTAGAPASTTVPDNWDNVKYGLWSGAPRFVGQLYIDGSSPKKVYIATAVTSDTSGWTVLN